MRTMRNYLHQGQIPYGASFEPHYLCTPEEYREEFREMRELGFSTIRISMDDCEPEAGRFDFRKTDLLFDEAAQAGIGVCPTLEPRYHGYRADPQNTAYSDGAIYQIDNPAYRERVEQSWREIIMRYRSHPALFSWILCNEPKRRVSSLIPSPYTWRRFQKWLEESYARDIAALNEAWYARPPLPSSSRKQFTSFTTIEPSDVVPGWSELWVEQAGHDEMRFPGLDERGLPRFPEGGWFTERREYDWIRFNQYCLSESYAWMSRTVHKYDPDHPTQVNPDHLGDNQAMMGRNLYRLGQSVDILGSSAHMAHTFHAIPQALEQVWEVYSFLFRRLFSNHKEGAPMITELQAGPSTWSGRTQFTPVAEDLVMQTMTAFGCGLKGIIYWTWKAKPLGWETAEWGLAGKYWSMNGRQGKVTEAPRIKGIQKIGRFLQTESSWFSRLAPVQPKVAILHSDDTEVLMVRNASRGWIPCENYQSVSEYGCYRALLRAGIHAEFICEDEVLRGDLAQYKCLFLPFNESMRADVGAKIATFVEGGGYVYGEAPLATRNENGWIYERGPGAGMEALFPEEIDILPPRMCPQFMVNDLELSTKVFVQLLANKAGRVLGAGYQGYPIVVETACGRGRSLYVGTCLTLFCGENPTTSNEERLLVSFAEKSGAGESWGLDRRNPAVYCYPLEGEENDAVILINPTIKTQRVHIPLKQAYAQMQVLLDGVLTGSDETSVVMHVHPSSAAVLRLQKS